MNWRDWLIVGLASLTGGWMLFDGLRSLIVGDYVTPKSGEYAGQLGPWANLVRAVGIDPRSKFMKGFFVLYGFTALLIAARYALGYDAQPDMIAVAVFGLWYLPVGTITNVLILLLLFVGR